MNAPDESTDTALIAALVAAFITERHFEGVSDEFEIEATREIVYRDRLERYGEPLAAVLVEAGVGFVAQAKAEVLEEAAGEIEPGTTFEEHPRAFLLGKAHRLRAAREDGA